jgi:hypothetical protein
MIIIEKDRHLCKEQPFFNAHKDLNDWYCSQDFNEPSTTFISLGDWFDTAIPNPEEVDESERFFNNTKFDKIYLLAGNHDFSTYEKTYSILPLRNNPRVEIITEPCVKTIQGKIFAFLPFIKNLSHMRELYSNLSDEFVNAEYVCFHFEDETISFGKKGQKTGIDLSYLKEIGRANV